MDQDLKSDSIILQLWLFLYYKESEHYLIKVNLKKVLKKLFNTLNFMLCKEMYKSS